MKRQSDSTPKKPALSKARREQNRRQFLRTVGLGVGMMTASLLGLVPVFTGAQARLRPPGALKDPIDEQQFLSSCIKCGLCVDFCPTGSLSFRMIGLGQVL